MPAKPTAYDAVNVVLGELLANVREILGQQFVGMYLYGSLASGDFSLQTSDVDFVVVSAGALSDSTVDALARMHVRLSAGESK